MGFLSGGHFWSLEAKKCEKPYSVDPKILSLVVFLPGEVKIDLLALYPKRFFSKSGLFVFSEFKTWKTLFYGPKNPFFCAFFGYQRPNMTFWHKIQKYSFQNRFFFVFYEWGCYLASGDHKTRKTLFRGPKNLLFRLENSFYCHFPASRVRKWQCGIKYKKKSFWNLFFCVFCNSHIYSHPFLDNLVLFKQIWPIYGYDHFSVTKKWQKIVLKMKQLKMQDYRFPSSNFDFFLLKTSQT